MKADPIAQLKAAKELISDASKWSKTHMATTKSGGEVWPTDPTAYSFDMIGALRKVAGDDVSTVDALKALHESIGKESIFEYNANHAHESILQAFDDAIQLLEGSKKTNENLKDTTESK